MEQTDVNTVAEASAATQQFDSWDDKGNPVVSSKTPPKTEEPAASAPPATEVKPEIAAESGTAPKQEPKERKPGEKPAAEERISQLTAAKRDLEAKVRELEQERERSRKPEPTPASEQPQTYADWRKGFKPADWTQKFMTDNPSSSFEDANAALADHLYDVRRAYEQADTRRQEGLRQNQEMLRKTTEKYPDAVEKVTQTAQDLLKKAPDNVQDFINDSDVVTDLIYALSDPETLNNVLETAKTQPGKALRALRDMELAIQKEVKASPEVKVPPAPEVKPRAPKPPSEVGGRGTPPEDALVAAARDADFAAFEAEQNRRMTAGRA